MSRGILGAVLFLIFIGPANAGLFGKKNTEDAAAMADSAQQGTLAKCVKRTAALAACEKMSGFKAKFCTKAAGIKYPASVCDGEQAASNGLTVEQRNALSNLTPQQKSQLQAAMAVNAQQQNLPNTLTNEQKAALAAVATTAQNQSQSVAVSAVTDTSMAKCIKRTAALKACENMGGFKAKICTKTTSIKYPASVCEGGVPVATRPANQIALQDESLSEMAVKCAKRKVALQGCDNMGGFKAAICRKTVAIKYPGDCM